MNTCGLKNVSLRKRDGNLEFYMYNEIDNYNR